MPKAPSKTEQWSNGVCSTCGKKIVFVDYTKADGTAGRLCLDPVPPCYKIIRREGKLKMIGRADIDTALPVFVTHFATCNDPAAHSKNN